MNAGRELDARIAEKVMGYQWEDDPATGFRYFRHPGKFDYGMIVGKQGTDAVNYYTLPKYSTDIAAAWLVVAQMATLGYWCQMRTPFEAHDGPDCWAGFTPHSMTRKNGVPDYWTQAETVPLAICLAALKAVDEA